MTPAPILTDAGHAAALARAGAISAAEPGTAAGVELDALVDAIVEYEQKRWPAGSGVPAEG